jgi:HK97 family phage major capsid protein
MLGAMLGERLGRITNTKYTTGSGASTPRGIVTAASSGVTAASGTQIAADELIGLVHSIDPAYRNGAGFMMHDNIVLHLRKLKDGNGEYMWQSGLRDGAPDRLLGYGITINQDMQSSVATGTKTVLFGQLSKYKIRRVNGMRLYRLQERYRDTDQDGFIAFIREDGNLLNAGTAPVKYLVQA